MTKAENTGRYNHTVLASGAGRYQIARRGRAGRVAQIPAQRRRLSETVQRAGPVGDCHSRQTVRRYLGCEVPRWAVGLDLGLELRVSC